MARLYYGHILSNGVKIHYYRTGDEKPPVVLLHGIMDNGLCWSRLALVLEPFYDVIMVDARGHGFSDAPENGYTPRDHSGDVAELIGQLGLKKPVLIGHSMGGITALTTAVLTPDLVGSLVLEAPPLWEDSKEETPEADEARAAHFKSAIDALKYKPFKELMELCQSSHPAWDEADRFQWAKSKQQVSPNVVNSTQTMRLPWREVVKKIACPGLLLTGDVTAGALVSTGAAEEIKKVWRKVKIVSIPGAGHNIRRDQFNLYYESVKPFLRSQTNW